MNCARYLCETAVLTDLKGATQREVIEELVGALCGGNGFRDAEILKSVYAADGLSHTALGMGVAVPHGRTDAIPSLMIAFGKSARGIEWNASDGEPVRMVWLIVHPERQAGEYLEAISEITRVSCRRASRDALITARDAREVIRIVGESRGRTHPRP